MADDVRDSSTDRMFRVLDGDESGDGEDGLARRPGRSEGRSGSGFESRFEDRFDVGFVDRSDDSSVDRAAHDGPLRARAPGPRLAIGRQPAMAVGLVVVLGLIVCGFLLLRPGPSEETLPPRVSLATTPAASAASVAQPALPVSSAGPAPGPTPAPTGGLSVYVVGQVRDPGVVSVTLGARVADAVDAAGGATRKADLTAINLARRLSDGEQIFVPRPGETAPPGVPAAGAQPSGSGGSGGAGSGAATGPINLNSATESDLDALPGVGPVLAGRIVEWREQNGPFASVDQLGEVSGIGDATLARLRPLVAV